MKNLTNDQICINYVDCYGTNRGAVVYKSTDWGISTIIGINSYCFDCENTKPSVSTHVAPYLDWIETTISPEKVTQTLSVWTVFAWNVSTINRASLILVPHSLDLIKLNKSFFLILIKFDNYNAQTGGENELISRIRYVTAYCVLRNFWQIVNFIKTR